MANIIKMAKIQSIRTLLEQGWSQRRISRELLVDRETVARYARLREAQASNPAIPPPGPAAGRRSQCEPLAEVIAAKLESGLSGKRVWQDLTADHGFTGGYDAVKRYVRRLGTKSALPFRRMEVEPGAEGQIDFGSAGRVPDGGGRRQSHVIRVALSNSRKGYSEAVFRQDTESFIRLLENAFRAFGGVPRTLVIDNLKAAVKNADWFDPELNPKVLEFARHYGTVFLPTKPYTPRHKGKVESGIKYVKNNALKGRTFGSLAEMNAHLREWERTVADVRIHGTAKKQVRQMFEEERKALLPLPAEPFPFYHEGKRRVHRDGHVEVARSYYSVPPEYLGRDVWVRWDSRLVRVFNDRFEQIAIHSLGRPGRFSTAKEHISAGKISGVERGAEYLLNKASLIGEGSAMWARAMLQSRGIAGVRVLQGFLSLTKRHPAETINRAGRTALEAGCFHLKPLRRLCAVESEQKQIEFAEEHELIRPLSEYQGILSTAAINQQKEEYE